MARVRFTQNLQRHLPCPDLDVPGGTVREVLAAAFAQSPALRGYVLDEQGALRRHMVVFVAGRQIQDRQHLGDEVPADAEVYVMQALSGG